MILVRVSMRLSFDDKSSIVEASIVSLRFALDNPNLISGIGIVDGESRSHGVQLLSGDSDIIQMVDR